MSDTAVKSAKKHSQKPKVKDKSKTKDKAKSKDKAMIKAQLKAELKALEKAELKAQAKAEKKAAKKAKAQAKVKAQKRAKAQKKAKAELKRSRKIVAKHRKITGGFFRRVSRRTARAFKRATKALARAAKRFGRGTKRGGKAVGRGTKRSAKAVGKGTKFGVGYVGRAATWTVSVVMNIALAIAAVVTMVAVAAVFAVLGAASWLASGWNTYVLGFFRWMTYRDGKVSFKKYRAMREAKSQARWDYISSSIEELFASNEEIVEELVEEPVEKTVEEIEAIVVPDPEPAPEAPLEVATKSALDDKVSLRVQADLDNAEESFPGAHAEQVASEDPYTAAETKYQPQNIILQTMGAWLGRHPEETPVKFRFVNTWTLDEQAEALQVLSGTAPGMIEQSYWNGRLYAVRDIGLDPAKLDAHGKAWAMVHAKHRQQNGKAISIKHLRAGFMDQVEDLKVQRDKAARKPVAS